MGDPPTNLFRIPEEEDRGELLDCCCETIQTHVQYNPMMVCTECKQIIKCFSDPKAYKNYVTFCNTRKRKLRMGKVGIYYTVIFKSHDQ